MCERFLSQSEDDAKLFSYMMEHESKNHLITCAILKRKDVFDKIDLQVSHAYSVVLASLRSWECLKSPTRGTICASSRSGIRWAILEC